MMTRDWLCFTCDLINPGYRETCPCGRQQPRTTQIPGQITFESAGESTVIQWRAADSSRGDQLAYILPADNALYPGQWRILAQDLGTGYTISVGPVHATLRAAQEWCLTYQDWPLLRPRVM